MLTWLRDHVPDLLDTVGPAELAAVAAVDRACAAAAAPQWKRAVRVLPGRLVARWRRTHVVCAPADGGPHFWSGLAARIKDHPAPPYAARRFLDLYMSRKCLSARVLDREACHAAHDMAAGDHRRVLDCRHLSLGAATRPLFRAVVGAVLADLRHHVAPGDLRSAAYCTLGIDVRVTQDGAAVVPGWERLDPQTPTDKIP